MSDKNLNLNLNLNPNLSRSIVSTAVGSVIGESNNSDPIGRAIENAFGKDINPTLVNRIRTESLLYDGLLLERDKILSDLETRRTLSRSLLDPLEVKHAKLLDGLKQAYADLYFTMNPNLRDKQATRLADMENSARKNKELEDNIKDAKATQGTTKSLYRKIAKKCHPDHNEVDEVLKAAWEAAKTALEMNDSAAMQQILDHILEYNSKSGAERKLISLIKRNDDLRLSIQNIQKRTREFNASFDAISIQLRHTPDVLEIEFVNIVMGSIEQTNARTTAIVAQHQLELEQERKSPIDPMVQDDAIDEEIKNDPGI